jgi:glycosyltransferase involved in cell wall biosynthesis
MKICHITSLHNRYDSRIFFKECLSLKNDGNEVFLLVNDNFADEIKNGIHIRSIRSQFKTRLHRFFLSNISNKFFKVAISLNADIYHFHDPELIFLGKRLIKIGKKVIYDIHEDYPREILYKPWIPKIIRNLVSLIFQIFENFYSKNFSGLVVVVPSLYDRFIKINSNTIVASNFPLKSDISKLTHYYNNNPLVYVGALTPIRGILQISKASNLIGKKLLLCGTFLDIKFQNEILNNFHNVQYLGQNSKSEVQAILQKSSIGLVTLLNTPNSYNSYPTKLFEYMAARIPIIASNFPNFKSFIEEAKCGICVDPDDIHEISQAIIYLLDNEEEAKKMGENGSLLIEKKYNWDSEYLKLISFYNMIIKDRN